MRKTLFAALFLLASAFVNAVPRTVDIHNTTEFTSWLSSQQNGDTVLFVGNVGTVNAPATGTVTAANVTFDVAFGATPNLLYFLSVKGADFEAKNTVTDFTGAAPSVGTVYQIVGARQKLTNVWIQTANVNTWPPPPATPTCSYALGVYCKGRQPVLASTDGTASTIFGGAFFNGHHGIYIQNLYANGPKTVDSVVLAYDKGCGGNCGRYAIHGYTEGGHSEGVVVKRSIIYGPSDRNLDVMLGGSTGAVPFNNTYDTNLFYNIKGVEVGYTVPPEGVRVTGNTFINSVLDAGARVGVLGRPWVIRDNNFIGNTTYLTVKPMNGSKVCTNFGIEDVIDGNTYQVDSTGKPKVSHTLCSPTEGNNGGWTLPTMRTKLQAHGCSSCDKNSVTTTGSITPVVRVVVTGPNRASIAVATPGVNTPHNVNVDLSPAVSVGTFCKIRWAEDNPYTGTPRWQGMYGGGTVSLPVNGEFEAFLLEPFVPPSPSPTLTATASNTPTKTPTPTKTNTPPVVCYTATATPTP